MKKTTPSGAFTSEFAAHKNWTLYRGVVDEIASIVGTERIVDVGAGIGHYVSALRNRCCRCIGIDGIMGIEELSKGLVIQQDITAVVRPDLCARIVTALSGPPEWAMSIEVGEHIPREHESALFRTLETFGPRGVICSWAKVGQKGRGHVNCRTSEYVTERMVRRGYTFDEEAVLGIRERLGTRKGIGGQLLVFRRGGVDE